MIIINDHTVFSASIYPWTVKYNMEDHTCHLEVHYRDDTKFHYQIIPFAMDELPKLINCLNRVNSHINEIEEN